MPLVRSESESLLSPELQAELGVPEHPAAFTWDAEAQAVQHSLGPEASAVIQELDGYELQGVAWSPADCSHLLVYGQWDVTSGGLPPGASTGRLSVLDLRQGRAVASSKIRGVRELMNHCDGVAWHPSQQGIILDCEIALEDEACFRQAGFAVAVLPDDLHIGTGFSEDAGHVVATWLDEEMLDDEEYLSERYTMLACSLTGQQLIFGERYGLPPVNSVQWMPDSRSLLLQMPKDSGFSSFVAIAPFSAPLFQSLAEPVGACLLLSPSAKFLADRGSGGLRTVDLTNGQQVWDASTTLQNLSAREGLRVKGIFGLPEILAKPADLEVCT